METRQKRLNGILLTMLMALVTISVGYAALSTTLNITTSTVKNDPTGVTWNIGFTGSSTPTAGGTSATGRSCGAATISSSSVSIAETTLSKPGDSCTYPLTIKNSGTIAGKLNSVAPTAPTSTSCTTTNATTSASAQMVCGNITYKLAGSANGSTNFVTGTTLAAGGTTTVYLIVSYTGSSLSSGFTQSAGKFTITYGQN